MYKHWGRPVWLKLEKTKFNDCNVSYIRKMTWPPYMERRKVVERASLAEMWRHLFACLLKLFDCITQTWVLLILPFLVGKCIYYCFQTAALLRHRLSATKASPWTGHDLVFVLRCAFQRILTDAFLSAVDQAWHPPFSMNCEVCLVRGTERTAEEGVL